MLQGVSALFFARFCVCVRMDAGTWYDCGSDCAGMPWGVCVWQGWDVHVKIHIGENTEAVQGHSKSGQLGANITDHRSGQVVRIKTIISSLPLPSLLRLLRGALPLPLCVLCHLPFLLAVTCAVGLDVRTPQAAFVATRLFASNLKEKMAQRFFNLVLLPRVRTDIEEHKRLNFHLFNALRKTIYKPAAFFKGILLPMAEVTPPPPSLILFCALLLLLVLGHFRMAIFEQVALGAVWLLGA